MTPWLAGAVRRERPSSIVAPMATVGQQLQRRPGGPSGSLRRPTQRSPRPRTELSENGIGDGGQQAAPAGHAADRPRSGRRGPRARESMDKEEERDPLNC